MKWPHLFEFMDQAWLPQGLRCTLREVLECGNSLPFRSYYRQVAEQAWQVVADHGLTCVVELGAGTAPVTREMLKNAHEGVQFILCDRNPDASAYRELAERYPQVTAPSEPIDFSLSHDWPRGTLLVLSATLHHIPKQDRIQLVARLQRSADCVIIAEPLRRTALSGAYVLGSIVPATLLPLVYLRRGGRLRRLLWCWLLPVAPLLFIWDGLVSCIRQWTEQQWLQVVRQWTGCEATILHSLCRQTVSLSSTPPRSK